MDIASIFTEAGGTFCIPYTDFQKKLSGIKAFIFDWDGVFNDGTKDYQASSNFSEVDAMGTNLLRFSRWLLKGSLPFTAVMSGEKNQLSFQLTNREHFHQGYFKVINKKHAFGHFLELHSLKAEEVCFVFDDVLDLPVATAAGLRIMVGRKGNPLFKKYTLANKLADYITGSPQYAVRETCELLMGVSGYYEKAVEARSGFTEEYKKYLEERQKTKTTYFTWKNEEIVLSVEF